MSSHTKTESDLRFTHNFYGVTGLTGGGDTKLDGNGIGMAVGTTVIIDASIGPTIPGIKWRLKTSGARPAAGSTIVHVVGDTDLYWQLAGS